ncbi:hypothetical protein WN944_001708 [Citrus x changshan-huyou]|uniref:CCHC-type domain-containing protein n=1 Tax=Citrus x changshan-huyou TaxID=2935761 RepID=A0AAP0MJW7_9ROSI
MNIHFYHKTIIKIDYNIVVAQRGKFARIAVQLDLEKPLVSQFDFEGRIQKVEYENLPLICFCCGKFGHYKDACPDGGVTPLATELPIPCPDAVNRAMVVGEVSDWNESKFGSWMVVTRKPRPRRPLEMESPKIPVQDQQGSKVRNHDSMFYIKWWKRKLSLKIRKIFQLFIRALRSQSCKILML